jgi:hypothetical protein
LNSENIKEEKVIKETGAIPSFKASKTGGIKDIH